MKFETVDAYDAVPRVLDFARKASLELVGIVSITRAPKVHRIEISFANPRAAAMKLLRDRTMLIHTVRVVML
jgi:hypothetical protein